MSSLEKFALAIIALKGLPKTQQENPDLMKKDKAKLIKTMKVLVTRMLTDESGSGVPRRKLDAMLAASDLPEKDIKALEKEMDKYERGAAKPKPPKVDKAKQMKTLKGMR